MYDPRNMGTARPWGSHLRVNGVWIEDDEGRRWRSVRDAFWQGRLGFPAAHFNEEQLELLLRVLTAMDRRKPLAGESIGDLLTGNPIFHRFYHCWLISVGLTKAPERLGHSDDVFGADLTLLGREVKLMLQATRERAWEDLPFTTVTGLAAAAADTGREEREAVLSAFEREARGLPYVFAREALCGVPAVTLTGAPDEGRMPMRRVVWTQTFGDEAARDRFYAWLAERVDRWEDWGERAFRYGGISLTQHLFGMIVA